MSKRFGANMVLASNGFGKDFWVLSDSNSEFFDWKNSEDGSYCDGKFVLQQKNEPSKLDDVYLW